MLGAFTLVALAAGQVAVARAGATLTVLVSPREATTVNIEPPGTALVLTVTAVRPTSMPPSKGDPNWSIEGSRARHSVAGLDLAVLGGELRGFEVDGLDVGPVRAGMVVRLPPASVLRIGPGWALVEHTSNLWSDVEVVMRVEGGPASPFALVEDGSAVRAVAKGADAMQALDTATAALVAHLARRFPNAKLKAIIDAAALASTGKTDATVEVQLALLR